jgi:hypothetical protein
MMCNAACSVGDRQWHTILSIYTEFALLVCCSLGRRSSFQSQVSQDYLKLQQRYLPRPQSLSIAPTAQSSSRRFHQAK